MWVMTEFDRPYDQPNDRSNDRPQDQPHDWPYDQPHVWFHEQLPDKGQDHDFHHEQKESCKLWLQCSFAHFAMFHHKIHLGTWEPLSTAWCSHPSRSSAIGTHCKTNCMDGGGWSIIQTLTFGRDRRQGEETATFFQFLFCEYPLLLNSASNIT